MSKCPGIYFDMGKKARDLLYKDYGQQPPIHFHYGYLDWNCDLSCKIEEIVPGLNTDFRFIVPDSSKMELQYLHDYAGITTGIGLKANPYRGYSPNVYFSGVIGNTLFSIGTELAFDITARTFSKCNAGLGFTSSLLTASLTMNDKFDTLKASCYRMLNPLTNTAVAAELKHGFTFNETSLSVGVQHALFPFTMVKARVNTYGRVGALIQQELWQKFYITVAGEVNFMDLIRVPKIGLSMALKP